MLLVCSTEDASMIEMKSKAVLFPRSYGLINLLSSVLETPVNPPLFSDVFVAQGSQIPWGARGGQERCGGRILSPRPWT